MVSGVTPSQKLPGEQLLYKLILIVNKKIQKISYIYEYFLLSFIVHKKIPTGKK